MATAKQALAIARRKWGKRAFVRENKRAMTPAMREERQAHVNALKAREKELDAAIKEAKHDWLDLLKAAEFCRDVKAQEPSLSTLGEAASKARGFIDLQDERRMVREEAGKLRGGLHVHRWDAGFVASAAGFSFASIHAQADTLDELLRRLEPLKNEELV